MLENVSHPFVRPNVLDVKLGTVLYEATASEEKRKRMEEQARNTTTLETGVRLTGFQVSLFLPRCLCLLPQTRAHRVFMLSIFFHL